MLDCYVGAVSGLPRRTQVQYTDICKSVYPEFVVDCSLPDSDTFPSHFFTCTRDELKDAFNRTILHEDTSSSDFWNLLSEDPSRTADVIEPVNGGETSSLTIEEVTILIRELR